ncbi:MAG: hypothetical protein J4215_04125 [Candidatus Diapherotrites archaeon]|uniref:SDR family oxidoreductase n=1 Tax=Candidatus Iainarchaeum sp. TaxID=3101447 RepID=A0A8T4L759_9ARCH|nr:hypothetical protein [Candidatus Diapherotrites archaeon]
MPKEKVESFGSGSSLSRAGQSFEIASCVVFLVSSDSSYIRGPVLHPNGSESING